MYGLYKKYKPKHILYIGRWSVTKPLEQRLAEHRNGNAWSTKTGMKKEEIFPCDLMMKPLFMFTDKDDTHQERRTVEAYQALGQAEWNRQWPIPGDHWEKVEKTKAEKHHDEWHVQKGRISDNCEYCAPFWSYWSEYVTAIVKAIGEEKFVELAQKCGRNLVAIELMWLAEGNYEWQLPALPWELRLEKCFWIWT